MAWDYNAKCGNEAEAAGFNPAQVVRLTEKARFITEKARYITEKTMFHARAIPTTATRVTTLVLTSRQ